MKPNIVILLDVTTWDSLENLTDTGEQKLLYKWCLFLVVH